MWNPRWLVVLEASQENLRYLSCRMAPQVRLWNHETQGLQKLFHAANTATLNQRAPELQTSKAPELQTPQKAERGPPRDTWCGVCMDERRAVL